MNECKNITKEFEYKMGFEDGYIAGRNSIMHIIEKLLNNQSKPVLVRKKIEKIFEEK